MGAGPSCDLRIDVASRHECKVAHVTPPDPQSQLSWEMVQFEQRARGF